MSDPRDPSVQAFGARFVEANRGLGVRPPQAVSVAQSRRRRRSLLDASRETLALYEEGGVLRWDEGVAPSRPAAGGRRRAFGAAAAPRGNLVTQFSFEELPPNQIGEYLTAADARLTPSQGLHRLVAPGGDAARAAWKPLTGPAPDARTLLLVHGTFSSIENFLGELNATDNAAGRAFLADALRDYEQVLGFGHPTLSVSPILNAVDLASLFAGVRSEVHVVAHSRGGLVTRWWLDGLDGGRLGPRRAVLVACPMSGTGLASPARIRATMDLLTNFARGLELAGQAASAVAPFMGVATVLGRVLKAVTGTLARTPLADAAVAMVPGLAGQSRVGNNFELRRLRAAATSASTSYYALSSNFEPAAAGWRFWRNFRKSKLADAAADLVFDAENDLVVDTASMTQLVDGAAQPLDASWSFGRSETVHHCNYFRQAQTIARLREWLGGAAQGRAAGGGARRGSKRTSGARGRPRRS